MDIKHKVFIFIVFAYLFPKLLISQQLYKPIIADPLTESWRWTNISELRNKSIRCIAQDKDETMWFGLDNGIMAYNGYDWSKFAIPNTYKDFSIVDLAVGKDGTVYSATTKGVFSLKEGTWSKVFPKESELQISVSSIEVLKDGSVLAGLQEDNTNKGIGGILHIKGAKDFLYISEYTNKYISQFNLGNIQKVVISDKYNIKNNTNNFVMNVVDLNVGKSGKIYAAVSDLYELGKIIVLKKDIGINADLLIDEVHSEKNGLKIRGNVKTAETDDGKLWVVSGAHELGIYELDNGKWATHLLSKNFGGVNNQNDILACSDGTLWVEGNGRIFIMKNNEWKEYKYPEIPKSSASKFFFFEAADKQVWVYGKLDEVFRFDNTFNVWVTYKKLNFKCELPNGTLWYLSEDGRVVVNKYGQWISYTKKDGLIDSPVNIIATSYGEIWAVGSHRNVAATCYFDGEKWHKKLHTELSWGIDYRAAFEAKDGALWFGSSVDIQTDKGHRGGVLCLPNPKDNKENWIHYPKDKSLIISNCYGIGQSKDERLWFGGKPLWVYDNGKWEIYKEDKKLTEYIDNIENDSIGNVWFGSRYFGVFRYDGKNWENYTIENGLPSNNVISIYAESENNIWVSTYAGACHFDGKTWNSDLFTTDLTITGKGGEIRKSQSGFLWFNHSSSNWNRRALTGNNKNLVNESFKTVRYSPDENPPETEITVFPETVEESQYTTVFWNGYDFYELTSANKLQYSWRLNGGEWSNFTKEKYHSFSNLLAGDYKLEVRARDQELNIDSTPAFKTFKVLQPWYKRIQFIVLVLIVLVIIAFLQLRIIKRNRKLILLNTELETQSKRLSEQNKEIENQKDKLTKTIEEVRKLSKSRLRFFTNVSHEFRTPLGLILGPVDELIEAPNSLEKKTKNKYYQLIKRNASRILKLVNQILEIYKVEESTLDYSPEKSDIVKPLKEIVALFEPVAKQKEIHLTFKSSQNEIVFNYDLDKIEKIVFNLLSNAFKNVRPHGKIEVKVSLKELDKTSGKTNVELDISDNGRGIPKDQLEKIFDRFYHNEPNDVEKSEIGMGIGLSYIKELVKIHNGTISVESTQEVLTNFKVSFPVKERIDAEEINHEKKPKNILSDRIYSAVAELERVLVFSNQRNIDNKPLKEDNLDTKIKLLIVEDDNDTRLFLKSSFSKEYNVLEAKNGREGIQIARTKNPDLIISDVMMPEMDGIQFCSILKSDFDTSHIPVILLTAKTLTEDKIKGYQTGADDYIEKPFNSKILNIKVSNIIKSRNLLKQRFQTDIDLKPMEMVISSIDDQFIQKGVIKVEELMTNTKLDAEMLAKELNVSRIQLYRKIKSLTGQTVNQFIKSIRIKHAARLLTKKELTISEIAYESGFSAPNHFSTYFKEHFGCSPTEYQQRFLLDNNK
jgi:signal transduction histidine kinase/DNA-binding response OmpR family regulator